MPKISIITICYNAASVIENTILSVLREKTADVEYLIIDGASKDNTVAIAQRYAQQIDVILSEPDKGIADAFNKGIRLATGEIIGLINAGDELMPGAIQGIFDHYDHHIDVYYGDCLINDIDNGRRFIRKAMPLDFMRYALPFSHQSCFITKHAYETHGLYSQQYKICMDYALIRKMHTSGCLFHYIPTVLAIFSYDGVSYRYPVRTMRENMTIACAYGLPRFSAFIYATKFILRHYIKKLLEFLGLFHFVAKIKDRQQGA